MSKNEVSFSLRIVLGTLLAIVLLIGTSILLLGPKLHVPMVGAIALLTLVKLRCGYNWLMIEEEMLAGISKILRVLLLFIVIGMLMGVWMAGGTIPAIVLYGINLISPSLYVLTAFLLMSVISYAMGTSVGATGTVGVALIMVGAALNLPLPLAAGAIVSGAYFGDRTSPLSATLNVTAVSTEVPVHRLVSDFLAGISPAWLLTALIYTYLGFTLGPLSASGQVLGELNTFLSQNMRISLWLLIPPLLLIFLAYRKVPILVNVFLNLLFSSLLALLTQPVSLGQLLMAMYQGYRSASGNAFIDVLLSRGGITAMLDMIVLCMILTALAGLLEGGGFLQPLIDWFKNSIRQSLIFPASLLANVFGNALSGSQVFAIILTGTIFNPLYDAHKMERRLLARAMADGGTLMAPLIPWNLNGLFMTGLLGVATFSYTPYAVLCWLTPFLTLLWVSFRGNKARAANY